MASLYVTILQLILCYCRATLDSYSKRVRGQTKSEYADVYPVMVSLLKKGLEVGEMEGEVGAKEEGR